MTETSLSTPWGTYELRRGSTPPSSPLRAWSAADVLALEDLAEIAPGRLLLVNDAWGALAVPTAAFEPTIWNDSALSFDAIAANRERNALEPRRELMVGADQAPAEQADTIVLMVPKSLALLEWQAQVLASVLAPGGRIIVAGMTRHLGGRVPAILEASLGHPVPRRAVRKARIIDLPNAVGTAPGAPLVLPIQAAFTTDEGVQVHEAPGVFSAGHLDVGTALLLETLHELAAAGTISPRGRVADLGAGNGVIATTLAQRHPELEMSCFDVSYLAAAACRATGNAAGLGAPRFTTHVVDGLGADGFGGESRFDLIVSNPPFHQDHAIDRNLTDRLLAQASERLNPGGTLVIVAQRHLELHGRLRRWFGRVDTVSKHPSHVVLVARA